ncbi:hypothetical protein ABIA33_002927 [Streptacidiphilus sp. MAP12-16]
MQTQHVRLEDAALQPGQVGDLMALEYLAQDLVPPTAD